MDSVGSILEDYLIDLNENKGKNFIKYFKQFQLIFLKLKNKNEKEILKELIDEIIKKEIQNIRGIYSDLIRLIITNYRKQLRNKILLISDSNNEHNQRYLNVLIELLGSWSNILSEILEYSLPNNILLNCINPFHLRIIEASFDCFEEFKIDKKLEIWSTKFLSYDSNGIQSINETINLTALDQILSQLVSMRLVVGQYQVYLLEGCFIPEKYNEIDENNQNNQYSENGEKSENNEKCNNQQCDNSEENNEIDNDNNETVYNSFIQLATDSNISKWKEVEGIYMVLERLYLQHAINHALNLCLWKNKISLTNESINNINVLIEVQPQVYALQVNSSFLIISNIITIIIILNHRINRALKMCFLYWIVLYLALFHFVFILLLYLMLHALFLFRFVHMLLSFLTLLTMIMMFKIINL